MAEKLLVTYKPKGHEEQSLLVDRTPKRFRNEEASKEDAKAIAEATLSLVPGTDYTHSLGKELSVNIVDVDDAGIITHSEQLFRWDHKASKEYAKKVKALRKRRSELKDARKKATKLARKESDKDWKARKEDKRTIGKWRARRIARGYPITVGIPLVATKLARSIFPHKKSAYERLSESIFAPYAGIGLGKDTIGLHSELQPGQPLEKLQEHIDGVLNRITDTVLDPADVKHGVGKDITRIIEDHQGGVIGFGIMLAQARFPIVRNILTGLITAEALTSPDKSRSKAMLLEYDFLQERARSRRNGHAHASEDAHLQLQQPTIPGILKDMYMNPGALIHRLLYPTTSVVATELDRRAERQDRIDLAYIMQVINDPSAEQKSPAYKRYRQDLTTALLNCLTRQKTPAETFGKDFIESINEAEHKALDELEGKLPPFALSFLKRELNNITEGRSNLPQDYKDTVTQLKHSSDDESYDQYIARIKANAPTWSTRKDLSKKDQELWRQAGVYADFMTGLESAARNVVSSAIPSRRATTQAA